MDRWTKKWTGGQEAKKAQVEKKWTSEQGKWTGGQKVDKRPKRPRWTKTRTSGQKGLGGKVWTRKWTGGGGQKVYMWTKSRQVDKKWTSC